MPATVILSRYSPSYQPQATETFPTGAAVDVTDGGHLVVRTASVGAAEGSRLAVYAAGHWIAAWTGDAPASQLHTYPRR